MRGILLGEAEWGEGNYGSFAAGGIVPGLVKRGLVEFLEVLDDGEGGRSHACYTLTPAGREYMADLKRSADLT